MEITEITDPVGEDIEREASADEQCEECGAPVERLQRYCVSCGARRLSVPDPALTYLAQASTRTRARPRPAGSAVRSRGRSRISSTTALLALVAILIAIGVGVLIGHGTAGGGNGSQLQKLSQQVSKLQAGGGSAGASSGGSSAKTTPTASGKSNSGGVDNATGKAYLKKELNSSGSSVAVP